jgi:hypothetical protein
MATSDQCILHHKWDPTGCGVPDDECESYAGKLAATIRDRASGSELAPHGDGLDFRAQFVLYLFL